MILLILERTKDAFIVLLDGGELKRLKGEIGEADMDVRQSLRIVEFLSGPTSSHPGNQLEKTN